MALDEEKKSFFQLLDTKSALLLGLVGGALTLGTIGFIVLGVLALKGDVNLSASVGSPTVEASPAVNNTVNNTPAVTVLKSDRPKVELFVMSYCPYGLQMEKAYLPALELLKKKADIDIKFVSYAMHGKKELDENTRQYCIQTEQATKFQPYLNCFMDKGDSPACLTQAGINQAALDSCYKKADAKFGITAKYNDKASWLSGQFPIYPVHEDLNNKYGVQGSPTLVINGAQVDVSRTPEAVKIAICAAFNNPPAECDQTLPNTPFSPGFGLAASAATAAQANCGS